MGKLKTGSLCVIVDGKRKKKTLSFKQNQMPQKVASICSFRVKKVREAQSSEPLMCHAFPNYPFLLASLATLHLKSMLGYL